MSDKLNIKKGREVHMSGPGKLFVKTDAGFVDIGEVTDFSFRYLSDDERFLEECGIQAEEEGNGDRKSS